MAESSNALFRFVEGGESGIVYSSFLRQIHTSPGGVTPWTQPVLDPQQADYSCDGTGFLQARDQTCTAEIYVKKKKFTLQARRLCRTTVTPFNSNGCRDAKCLSIDDYLVLDESDNFGNASKHNINALLF